MAKGTKRPEKAGLKWGDGKKGLTDALCVNEVGFKALSREHLCYEYLTLFAFPG